MRALAGACARGLPADRVGRSWSAAVGRARAGQGPGRGRGRAGPSCLSVGARGAARAAAPSPGSVAEGACPGPARPGPRRQQRQGKRLSPVPESPGVEVVVRNEWSPSGRNPCRAGSRGSAEGQALPASGRLHLLSGSGAAEKVTLLQRVGNCFVPSEETRVPQGCVFEK